MSNVAFAVHACHPARATGPLTGVWSWNMQLFDLPYASFMSVRVYHRYATDEGRCTIVHDTQVAVKIAARMSAYYISSVTVLLS